MSHVNHWANPTKASLRDVHDMAVALEARAQAHDQVPVNRALLAALAPLAGERILEVGCGSGVLCRQIVPALVPGGKITGVDISPAFLKIAQGYATRAEASHCMQWGAGRCEALPFQAASFDSVLAARLLLHVSNPLTVLSEITRVVRPGGRVVIMDWDFDTLAIDHSNREMTRRLTHWRCDHHGGNNWSGRQLWRQMRAAGLVNVKLAPVVSIAHQENDSLTLSLFKAAQVARDAGAIALHEYEAWLGELRTSLAAGCFFASIVYFIGVGERQTDIPIPPKNT